VGVVTVAGVFLFVFPCTVEEKESIGNRKGWKKSSVKYGRRGSMPKKGCFSSQDVGKDKRNKFLNVKMCVKELEEGWGFFRKQVLTV